MLYPTELHAHGTILSRARIERRPRGAARYGSLRGDTSPPASVANAPAERVAPRRPQSA